MPRLEELIRIPASDALVPARIARHIGNRHTPAEITDDVIHILPDHVLADMVRRVGGSIDGIAPVRARRRRIWRSWLSGAWPPSSPRAARQAPLMRDLEVVTQRTSREFPTELTIRLSPAFPVGGFACSRSLETAVAKHWGTDFATLAYWIQITMKHGTLCNDLILMGLAVRATTETEIEETAQLAIGPQPSAERAKETLDQGRSFRAACQAAWQINPDGSKLDDENPAFPVAVGPAARDYGFSARDVLEAYAVCLVSNQLSIAIQRGVVGQDPVEW